MITVVRALTEANEKAMMNLTSSPPSFGLSTRQSSLEMHEYLSCSILIEQGCDSLAGLTHISRGHELTTAYSTVFGSLAKHS